VVDELTKVVRSSDQYQKAEAAGRLIKIPTGDGMGVNERVNLAGAGLNIAKRVMDCGDAGHILISKHVAEDLENTNIGGLSCTTLAPAK